QHFRELRRDDRILALLIEGEPAESFPPVLYEIRQSVSGERTLDQDQPLAADVRQSLETKPHIARRWAKLRLLATLLGCTFDDLRRREQERQFRRVATLAAVAIVGLFVFASLAIAAFREKSLADQKTVEAVRNASAALTAQQLATLNESRARESEQQARVAQKIAIANESRALMALSQTASSQGRYTDAVKLALAAWPRSAVDERPKLSGAIDALADGLAGPLEVSPRLQVNDRVFPFPVVDCPDGKQVVTPSDDTARVWDTLVKGPFGSELTRKSEVRSPAYSPDGARVVTLFGDVARLWDAETGKPIGAP